MQDLFILFAVLAGLATLLTNIAIWAPRRLWLKLGALAVTAVLLPAGYLSLAEMLSRPKPVGAEWARQSLAEAPVIGAHMREGEAIYVWLTVPGAEDPRAYALPWDQQMAKQLRGAQREAEATGTQLRMRRPFEQSLDKREAVFYAAPPPPPPVKATAQRGAGMEFTPSTRGGTEAGTN